MHTCYKEIKFRQWGYCPRHQQSGSSNPDYVGPESVPLTPTQEVQPWFTPAATLPAWAFKPLPWPHSPAEGSEQGGTHEHTLII